MRLIAKKAPKEMVSKLLQYSSEYHGVDSAAHQFIVLEASENPVSDLVFLHDKANNTNSSVNPGHPSYPATPVSLYYLYLSGNEYRAYDILRDARIYSPEILPEYVAAIWRAAARLPSLRELAFMDLGDRVPVLLHDSHDALAMRVAIAETAAYGDEDLANYRLNELIKAGANNLDEVLGEAIISAARRGKSALIFKLCERARELQVDKTKRFTDLLSCAAGAALVNDHFSLAKIIMLMVPHFQAKPLDLQELQKWPVVKIERMFRAIGNYKIFTDIAMHSGLAPESKSMNWARALKKEYGLENMSDEGFSYLVNHPEPLYVVFKYRPDLSPTLGKPSTKIDRGAAELMMKGFEGRLSPADMQVLMKVVSEERDNVQAAGSNNHFFRAAYFTREPTDVRISPAEERVCLVIKENLSQLLLKRLNAPLARNKEAAARLHTALMEVDSLQMIRKYWIMNQNPNCYVNAKRSSTNTRKS